MLAAKSKQKQFKAQGHLDISTHIYLKSLLQHTSQDRAENELTGSSIIILVG